jgi:hypothetical protein
MKNEFISHFGILHKGDDKISTRLFVRKCVFLRLPMLSAGRFTAFFAVISGKSGLTVDIEILEGKGAFATTANIES